MSIFGIHHVTIVVDDLDKATWFYGRVLGLKEKPRPTFNFPGLFYFCGNQEIHLIITPRPLSKEDLCLQVDRDTIITRRYIHRHAALLVSDWPDLKSRLIEHGSEIVFDGESP